MLKFPIKRTIIIDDTKKKGRKKKDLSLIHISEPTRQVR